MKAWTLQALNQARLQDLTQCTDEHERGMCDAVCRREIRDLAISKRNLNPGDIAILESLGLYENVIIQRGLR